MILSDIICQLLAPPVKSGDSHFLSQKYLSWRKNKSLWAVMAPHSICSKLTAHSPGFALDHSPEQALLIPTAGTWTARGREQGPFRLHSRQGSSKGSPFPCRNSWMGGWPDPAGKWDSRWEDEIGKEINEENNLVSRAGAQPLCIVWHCPAQPQASVPLSVIDRGSRCWELLDSPE